MHKPVRLTGITCALLFIASSARANLYNVSLSAVNSASINGVVDTTANTFTITAWTNLGVTSLWTPAVSSLPITLTAQTSSGAAFDVPDNFTGNVGSAAGYGFFLPLGTFSEDLTWNQGVPLLFQSSFGWGGLRTRPDGNYFYGLEAANVVGYIPASDDTHGRFFADPPLNVIVTPAPEPALIGAISICLLIGSRQRRLAI